LLTKDAAGKSTGVTEALERRFESETKELDNKIKELNTKLKSLDNIVQHHERRREKLESLKKEIEKQGNELTVQKSTLEVQQSATQQLFQGVKDSDQNIGRLKSKITILESNDDFLRKKLARMATYLEDPVWQRVQEEITRREYGKIQSRERSRQWELHRRRIEEACDQQFASFKPKMSAAITKVLMVQKTLIV
jgi:chromosome segregation ATPase